MMGESSKDVKYFPTDMTWGELQAAANEMSETEAFDALDIEKNGKRRKSYLLRLYSRYSVMRAAREREAIKAWAVETRHGGH